MNDTLVLLQVLKEMLETEKASEPLLYGDLYHLIEKAQEEVKRRVSKYPFQCLAIAVRSLAVSCYYGYLCYKCNTGLSLFVLNVFYYHYGQFPHSGIDLVY